MMHYAVETFDGYGMFGTKTYQACCGSERGKVTTDPKKVKCKKCKELMGD